MTLKKSSKTGPKIAKKRTNARYGWVPDLPDHRDFTYAAPGRRTTADSETTVDLRPHCPPVYDQGPVGSCTGNAIAAALEFAMIKQGEDAFTPSRLFIYYNERAMEGTIALDAGAQIRDGIKSVASQGDCPETMWPYDMTRADPNTNLFPEGARAATQPSDECYAEAVKHEALTYLSVAQNLADMKGCLAEGFPFVFGFTVYESFESKEVAMGDNAGWVPMPKSGEAVLGGHAVVAVGYDNDDRVFICRNSWGTGWGDQGYFYMPYAYFLDDNLSNDFWTIRLVE
ncbi:MAG TPA: C1 family peptidase [Pirellulales bacterium]|nr:C1 family peptidase [Pirellulales bacterium]